MLTAREEHRNYNLGRVMLVERVSDNIHGVKWLSHKRCIVINDREITRENIFDFPITLVCSSKHFSICCVKYDTPANWPNKGKYLIVLKDMNFIDFISDCVFGKTIGEVFWVRSENAKDITDKMMFYSKCFISNSTLDLEE